MEAGDSTQRLGAFMHIRFLMTFSHMHFRFLARKKRSNSVMWQKTLYQQNNMNFFLKIEYGPSFQKLRLGLRQCDPGIRERTTCLEHGYSTALCSISLLLSMWCISISKKLFCQIPVILFYNYYLDIYACWYSLKLDLYDKNNLNYFKDKNLVWNQYTLFDSSRFIHSDCGF